MAGVPPKRGEAYTFPTFLTSQADTNIFQINPTLAAGDVEVSIDGGAWNNITALPTVSPAGSDQVLTTASAAEMSHAIGGSTMVRFHDAAGNEWQDQGRELRGVETPIDQVAAAVWNVLAATLTTVGSIGKLLVDRIDAAISSRSTLAQADILSDATPFAGANVDQASSTTESNIRGADGDDLKNISDEIAAAGGVTAADVWDYTPYRTLTQSAVEIAAAAAGDDLAIQRGDTWIAVITGLGNLSGRSKLWFTAKTARTAADAGAIIQTLLTEPADPDDGLQRLNGEEATKTWGSIVVDDEVAGNITITLGPTATALLAATPGKHYPYDIQVLRTTGAVNTLRAGLWNVEADTTKAID